ncbi:hypothetical protein [Cohnella yongneupensis]|uniref:Uncharacterized protein n=1 Tax=Cohnella yongneupensis TaxID=425006 RepID=A0ABW0QTI8_9BACL
MRKPSLFFIAIVIAMLLMTNHYMNYSVGDSLFRFIGTSPWTEGDSTGMHLPVVLGLILIVVGIAGASKAYKPTYPKIVSRIIIGCILFSFLYPWATEKAAFIIKHNATGMDSFDYSKKDSSCTIRSDKPNNNQLTANCSFTIFNYGNESQLTVRPIVSSEADLQFEAKKIMIPSHTKVNVGAMFDGVQNRGTGFSGTVSNIELVIESVG